MGQDAGTPPGMWERVRSIAAEEVGKFMRSGLLRNASITDGGLSVRNGFIRLLDKVGGVATWYVGPVSPNLPDGSPQPGYVLRRNDGTVAQALYDPIPSEGDYNQFLATFDRQGNIVFSDDTDSGQGIARPYLPGTFYRADYADWVSTTSTTFVTKFRAKMFKQQPKLYVRAWASNDTSGATGEVQVLVNGVQWGPVRPIGFAIGEVDFGPLPVDGANMSLLIIEIQARVASGTGGIRVEPSRLEGRQS